MGDKILNLDKLIQDDKELILQGNKFIVPGSLGVLETMEIVKAAQGVQEDPNKIKDQLEKVWDVLERYNKGKKKEDFINNIKLSMLEPLMDFILGNPIEAVDSKPGKEDSTTQPEIEK